MPKKHLRYPGHLSIQHSFNPQNKRGIKNLET